MMPYSWPMMDTVKKRLAAPSSAVSTVTAESTSEKPTSLVPSAEDLTNFGWQVANFITLVGATSTSITLVQSPLNSVILNQMRYGSVLPPALQGRMVSLAAVRNLYAGVGTQLVGSGARSVYVTTTKKNSTVELCEYSALEEGVQVEMESRPANGSKKISARQLGYVAAASLGDTLVTQIPDSKGQLIKAEVIDASFKWKTAYNIAMLSKMGVVNRFNTGLVNFSALCLLEGTYAQYMPFSSESANHFMAGALSGMNASVCTYPLGLYRDHSLNRVKVVNGQLVVPTTREMVTQVVEYVQQKGWRATLTEGFKEFGVQAPLRAVRTGATFAIVAGVGELVGANPLASVRASSARSTFFGSSPLESKRPLALPAPSSTVSKTEETTSATKPTA